MKHSVIASRDATLTQLIQSLTDQRKCCRMLNSALGPSPALPCPFSHSVSVKLPASCCNKVKGLCGTFNPALQFSDVYTTASGTVGWYPSSRWGGPFGGTFQTEFVESWRVAPDRKGALFTEAECPTGTPTIPTDPPELFANCPEKRAQAEANCPQGRFYESCLTDVGVTCNDAWVTHCGGSNDDFTDIDDGDIDTPEDPGVPANQLPPGPPATGRTRTLMRTNPPLAHTAARCTPATTRTSSKQGPAALQRAIQRHATHKQAP